MLALGAQVVATGPKGKRTIPIDRFFTGLFSICTGSYDFKHAFAEVDGVYTNKPPGGIAYRCSFRVTEAVHTIERMVDVLAHKIGLDPADLRLKNFIPSDKFPLRSPLGWEYDSGNYAGALKKAMDLIGYGEPDVPLRQLYRRCGHRP
jgi:carbon-monoxide dehydrogenase large subunit